MGKHLGLNFSGDPLKIKPQNSLLRGQVDLCTSSLRCDGTCLTWVLSAYVDLCGPVPHNWTETKCPQGHDMEHP